MCTGIRLGDVLVASGSRVAIEAHTCLPAALAINAPVASIHRGIARCAGRPRALASVGHHVTAALTAAIVGAHPDIDLATVAAMVSLFTDTAEATVFTRQTQTAARTVAWAMGWERERAIVALPAEDARTVAPGDRALT